MASRAAKKWRFRKHGVDRQLSMKAMATGLVDSEAAIHWDLPEHEKMSKVLLDFVAPYTASARSHEEIQKLVVLGLVAWNAALLPEEERRKPLADLASKAAPADTVADLLAVIGSMVERKEQYFAENRRLILAHRWTVTARGPHLSVVSTMT
jgi:hypothetical protein